MNMPAGGTPATSQSPYRVESMWVGYNKVFGYYIEVSKSFVSQVPERFIRKQTLTTGERYITEELKTIENQILGAEEKVVNLEYNAFVEIRTEIAKNIKRLQKTANVVSTLDVLSSFAQVAEDMNYCMPVVKDDGIINIKEGRHPVIEKMIGSGNFVPNDTYLDKEGDRLAIITGNSRDPYLCQYNDDLKQPVSEMLAATSFPATSASCWLTRSPLMP